MALRSCVAAALVAMSLPAFAIEARIRLDLQTPADFRALRESNPDHYRRALEVIKAAEENDCATVEKAVLVRAAADDVACSPAMVLTSWPAKKALSFRLDDRVYATHILVGLREKLTRLRRDAPVAP